MVTWKLDPKRGYVSIGIHPSRAFWRDSAALFESARGGAGGYLRPKAVDQAASLEVCDVIGDRAFTVEVAGLLASKSRVDAMRVERVWARAKYFDDLSMRDGVRRALAHAEAAVGALVGALRVYARHALAEAGRIPDGKDIGNLVSSLHAEPQAWSALGVEFDAMLRGFADDVEDAVGAFIEAATGIVRTTFDRATAVADGSARSLKARALGSRSLSFALRALAPAPPQPEVHP